MIPGLLRCAAWKKPTAVGAMLLSTSGSSAPRWSIDGKEIYFIGPDEKMMAVSIAVENKTIKLGKPIALFATQHANLIFKHQYVVGSNGQLAILNPQAQEAAPIAVILNLETLLRIGVRPVVYIFANGKM